MLILGVVWDCVWQDLQRGLQDGDLLEDLAALPGGTEPRVCRSLHQPGGSAAVRSEEQKPPHYLQGKSSSASQALQEWEGRGGEGEIMTTGNLFFKYAGNFFFNLALDF